MTSPPHPRLAPQRDEEEDGGEAVQHLTGLQLALPSDTHTSGLRNAVLRIRLRDPVPFWPLDPGSGMDEK